MYKLGNIFDESILKYYHMSVVYKFLFRKKLYKDIEIAYLRNDHEDTLKILQEIDRETEAGIWADFLQ